MPPKSADVRKLKTAIKPMGTPKKATYQNAAGANSSGRRQLCEPGDRATDH